MRSEKNLTQEELVAKSYVSVRTIQRIEAGEVQPRVSTVRILLEALGEPYESFSTQTSRKMETQKPALPTANRNTLLVGALAGAVYLICQIVLGAMDISWFMDGQRWGFRVNAVYATLTVLMVVSYGLFAWGFVALGSVFENSLLKVIAYILIAANVCLGILDVTTLSIGDVDSLWLAYVAAGLIFGALSIVFGVALIRLDGMGEISRIAGILEIAMGCLLVTVVLFFVAYVILIPTVVVEILVLYRGYEYLSRSDAARFAEQSLV